MRMCCVILFSLGLSAIACGTGPSNDAPAEPAAPAAPAAKAHGNLLQVMRAIDFPNSNTIFDTQTKDPAAPPEKSDSGDSASSRFSGLYGGWEAVENSAIALAETANLLLIPGRVCSNGKPVPVDDADFRKYTQILADAGLAAYKAAQSKNQDAMVEVSGTVADACALCHEVYRDRGPAGSPERCTAAPADAAPAP